MREVDEIRARVANWTKESAGATNCYVCEDCRGAIKTLYEESGVTPFLIECRATTNCTGSMMSTMGVIVRTVPTIPTHVWYRCESVEELLEDQEASIRKHVDLLMRYHPPYDCGESEARDDARYAVIEHWRNGGLELREITDEEDAAWERANGPKWRDFIAKLADEVAQSPSPTFHVGQQDYAPPYKNVADQHAKTRQKKDKRKKRNDHRKSVKRQRGKRE